MSADASAGAPATVASALPPNPSLNPPPFIYRIVPQADWEATFEKTGHYKGSPLDVKDGFIHISDKPEVAKTAALYYANEKQLVLLQLNVQELFQTGQLKWDWVPKRNTYFPHFYDLEQGFVQKHIHKVHQVGYDEAAGKHILPELE